MRAETRLRLLRWGLIALATAVYCVLPAVLLWIWEKPLWLLLAFVLLCVAIVAYVESTAQHFYLHMHAILACTREIDDCDPNAAIAQWEALLETKGTRVEERLLWKMLLASVYANGIGDYASSTGLLEQVANENLAPESRIMTLIPLSFYSHMLGDKERCQSAEAQARELLEKLEPGSPARVKYEKQLEENGHLMRCDSAALEFFQKQGAGSNWNYNMAVWWHNMGKCHKNLGEEEERLSCYREVVKWGGKLYFAKAAAQALGLPEPQGLSPEAKQNRRRWQRVAVPLIKMLLPLTLLLLLGVILSTALYFLP